MGRLTRIPNSQLTLFSIEGYSFLESELAQSNLEKKSLIKVKKSSTHRLFRIRISVMVRVEAGVRVRATLRVDRNHKTHINHRIDDFYRRCT